MRAAIDPKRAAIETQDSVAADLVATGRRRWRQELQKRDDAIRAEQARVAAFYEQQAAQREQRENEQACERFQQQQRPG